MPSSTGCVTRFRTCGSKSVSAPGRKRVVSGSIHVPGATGCFHVNLSVLDPDNLETLWLSLAASTGTAMVRYDAWRSDGLSVSQNPWIGTMDLSPFLESSRT